MELNMYPPILILVISNVFYHVTTKSVPEGLSPFIMIIGTYIVGALFALILYFLLRDPGSTFMGEVGKINWTTIVLGLSIVGLEAGAMLMYKVGWNISLGNLVASAVVTVALVIIGIVVYKEQLNIYQVGGILMCGIGLVLLNMGK